MKQLNDQNRQFRDIWDSSDARDCRQYLSSNSGQTHVRKLRRQFLDLGGLLFLIPYCTGAPLPPTARGLGMAAAPSGNGTWERGRSGMHPSTVVSEANRQTQGVALGFGPGPGFGGFGSDSDAGTEDLRPGLRIPGKWNFSKTMDSDAKRLCVG